jgi:chromosome segregation ATPase
MTNEALNFRVNKLEQTNQLLTQSLTSSEQTQTELETQLDELRRLSQQAEQQLIDLQIEYKTNEKHLHKSKKEIESLKEKFHVEFNKNRQLHEENEDLKESNNFLQQQIQEKILHEEQYNREKQLNSNFKDFIQVKRTLQACQQENEHLKIELKKLQIKLFNKND